MGKTVFFIHAVSTSIYKLEIAHIFDIILGSGGFVGVPSEERRYLMPN